jgi:uncharacterized protein YkwD
MKFFLSTCAALVFAATTTMAAPVVQRELQAGASAIQLQLLSEVNLVRAANGKPPLCLNTKLTASAQGHAADMARGGFISATGTGGTTPTVRATAQQFNSSLVGEIVGAGYTDASVAVKEWMSSPAYSVSVLGDYKYLGAGQAVNEAQMYKSFWVLDFDKDAVGEKCA